MATPTFQSMVETGNSAEAKAIAALVDGADVKSALIRLSDLDRGSIRRTLAAMEQLAAAERARVTLTLVDAAETTVDLNFHRLLRELLGDSAPEVRRLAIAGLWEDETTGLRQRYLELLITDPDQDVRAQAAEALRPFCSMLALERDGDDPESEAIAQELLAISTNPLESVLVRRRATEALGALDYGQMTDDHLTIQFEADDQAIAAGALRGMGLTSARKWMPIVEQEMVSPDAEMRFEAAGAAGLIGHVDFVPGLAILMDDEDPEVRAAAAIALGRIGGDAALRILQEHLDRDEEEALLVQQALEEALLLEDPLADLE